MKLLLASPRGFCAGVDRAIEIVEEAICRFGAPVYVRHEVVHNRFVVNDLRAKGAVFVEELDEVPDDAIVIFSAHGIPQSVRAEAARRGLRVFDATCPLVTKVHVEVIRQRRDGVEVILIGHAGHPEVEGTLGQAEDGVYLVETPEDVARLAVRNPARLAFVTQTTLSMDDTARVIAALRERFPAIRGPRKDDICYATQNRQDAVRSLARDCEVMIVVGSRNSSNSNRLREVAETAGCRAWMVDGPDDLQRAWFLGVERIGLTAGASAPEVLVKQVIARLEEWGVTAIVEQAGSRETVYFALPRELRASPGQDGR